MQEILVECAKMRNIINSVKHNFLNFEIKK